MKILFAHDHIINVYKDDYYSNGSFSKQVLDRYLQVFDQMKFMSRQINIDYVPDNLTLATNQNVEFVKIPNIRSLKTLNKFFKVNQLIKEQVEECECLIARLPSTIGELAIKHAKKLNKKYIIEVVGCAWDSNFNHGSLFGKINAPLEFVINKRLIRDAEYVIYITKGFLQGRYPTNGISTVCPNVNINIVNQVILNNRINKIKSNNNIIKFGLVGSLDVDYKGHDTVIKALGMIKKDLPNFKIEFLGNGNSDRWSKLIRENGLCNDVTFVGTLPNGEMVYKWMDQIDIMLQPSYAEAQGRCIIEAMSRGCPVIATRVGGIVELIEGKWLINAGDYKDLAEKIKKMTSDSSFQLNQANNNFNESMQYYKESIEADRNDFLKLFKNATIK